MDWKSLEKMYDTTHMKDFILHQGDAVRISVKNSKPKLEHAAKLAARCDDIIITGAGDKYLIPELSRFVWDEFADKPISVIHSRLLAEDPPKYLNKNSCVIFLSQSGETKDTMEALNLCMKRGATCIGISNMKDISPDSFILIDKYKKGMLIDTYTTWFREEPLPSTQTFHTTHILLNLLLLHILQHLKKRVSHLVSAFESIHSDITRLTQSEHLISWAKEKAEQLAHQTAGFYVLGDGIRYGIARKAALIMFMEGCKQDASHLRTEEFSHSLIETLEPENRDKYTLILLKPHKSFTSKGMGKQIKFIERTWKKFSGKRVLEICPYNFMRSYEKASMGNLLSPTFYAIQIEWLAYYLALARKIDPGVSHLVKKVRKSG